MPTSEDLKVELADSVSDLEQLPPEARRIVRELIALLRSQCVGTDPGRSTRGLLSLKGLGKEIWKDEPAEIYVGRERESWKR